MNQVEEDDVELWKRSRYSKCQDGELMRERSDSLSEHQVTLNQRARDPRVMPKISHQLLCHNWDVWRAQNDLLCIVHRHESVHFHDVV